MSPSPSRHGGANLEEDDGSSSLALTGLGSSDVTCFACSLVQRRNHGLSRTCFGTIRVFLALIKSSLIVAGLGISGPLRNTCSSVWFEESKRPGPNMLCLAGHQVQNVPGDGRMNG